jgi:RHS repeat-associated protein
VSASGDDSFCEEGGPVTFANGDRFGARARADGIVEVYRNDSLLGMCDVSGWPDYASGGYVGLWLVGASNTLLDDFGGGTSAATTGVITVTTIVITYTYDPLYRLTSATSTGAYTTTFGYAYDAVGNRTVQTRTIASTEVITYQFDNANRLTQAGGVNYTWDNNGNLLNDGSASYLYDRANRLISTTLGGTTSLFNYNGDGARLKQTVAGAVTTYTQDLAAPLPVVLQAKTGSVTTQYLYTLSTRPLAQNGGAWEYLLPDALGSVRQIVDAGGNVTLAMSYEPYGTVLTSMGTASSIFGYAGEQADTYIKLVFLRARYYSPEMARFLSKDVWQGDYTRPQSFDGWAYAENNSISATDLSGLITEQLDAQPFSPG